MHDMHDKVIGLDMMVRHILIVPLSMRYSTFSLALAAAPPSTSGPVLLQWLSSPLMDPVCITLSATKVTIPGARSRWAKHALVGKRKIDAK